MNLEPKRKKGESKKHFVDRHKSWSNQYSKPLSFWEWLDIKLKEWL